jgi:hypothetical protein
MSSEGLRCLERVADMICFKSMHMDLKNHLSARGDGSILDNIITDDELESFFKELCVGQYNEHILLEKLDSKIKEIISRSAIFCTDAFVCQYLYDSIPKGVSDIHVGEIKTLIEIYCHSKELDLSGDTPLPSAQIDSAIRNSEEKRNWQALLQGIETIGYRDGYVKKKNNASKTIYIDFNPGITCMVWVDGYRFFLLTPLGKQVVSLNVSSIIALLNTVCSDYIQRSISPTENFRLPLKIGFGSEMKYTYGTQKSFEYSILSFDVSGGLFQLQTSYSTFTGPVSKPQIARFSELRCSLVSGTVYNNPSSDALSGRLFCLVVGKVGISLDVMTMR